MIARTNTPSPAFKQILTGHYREAKSYTTWHERGTTDWLIILTLGGQGRFLRSGQSLISGAGEIILIPPGAPHDYATAPAASHWELLWAHFHPRPHWRGWLEWPEGLPGVHRLTLHEKEAAARIEARLFDAHRLATGGLRLREELAMNALEEALLWCDTLNPISEQPCMDGRIRRVIDYLCSNLSERITLESLAWESSLSVSRLAHLFREQVGTTPLQFLEAQRIERARQLLELTPHTIQSISYEVGFESPYYFTLRFKRVTGQSPRDYRKAVRSV